MRILGIDPGYERLGIAVVEKDGGKKDRVLFSECFKTSSKIPHEKRLGLLGREVARVILKYHPDALSIETLFFNANQKTALAVAEARGVILYEAAIADIPAYEYTPLQIKIAVTGYGRGTKDQVYEMVSRLAELGTARKQDDEFDAIATAITHIAHSKNKY